MSLSASPATPERRSAEVISIRQWAAAHRRAEPSWPDPLVILPHQQAALDALGLSTNDRWAAEAATAYLGDRIAGSAAAIEASFDPRTGRFDLPAYIGHALDGAPVVLPLPAPPAGLLARLVGRLH